MKTTKRIVSAILCVLMIGSVLPLTSFAKYENTHVNTGDQIEDLIAVATTQVGYTEGNSTSQMGGTSGGSGNYTKYGAWYPMNGQPWCAMFVSWCANQAGISTSVIPKHASCDIGMQWFQNNGYWQWSRACGSSYTPKRGDIIYFRTNTSITYDSTHVGIVSGCNGSTVYTIEGNASNKCQTKDYAVTDAHILGYGTPAYTVVAPYSTGTYKVTASSLNMRNQPTTSGTTVLQALPTGAVVTVTQVSGTWGYCTYNGTSGWIHLGYCVATDPTYYLTFNPNGGTIQGNVYTYAIKDEQYYREVLTGGIPVATRTGYQLSGWYCEKYNYTLGLDGQFVVKEDVTFDAVWTPHPGRYKITAGALNIRDGAGKVDTNILGTITQNEEVNITAFNGDWGFITYNNVSGWVSLAYCQRIGDVVEEETPGTGTDTTKTYTLTFELDGGTMPANYTTSYEFKEGELMVNVIGGFPVPTKSGYDFYGWRWTKAGYDTRSYRWTDGWGTQVYAFWDADNNRQDVYVNATLIADWVDHSHTYETTVTKAATCYSTGIRTKVCTSCGETTTSTIAKTDHNYVSQVTVASTCIKEGTMTYTCSSCGDAYTTTITKTDHQYTYSGGNVKCIGCNAGWNGWYGERYCTNGAVSVGLFNDGTAYYYAGEDGTIVKSCIVYITVDKKNGLLTDCQDGYYSFASDGKLVATGFVEQGNYTCYYSNGVRAKGLTQIDGNYYYFDDDGNMVRNAYRDVPAMQGVPAGTYYFRSNGTLDFSDNDEGKQIVENNGKKYLYINGVLQTGGLYIFDGDFYYAYRDGTLAADVTFFVYNTNNLLPPAYYHFNGDTKMQKNGWVEVDAERSFYFENAAHCKGLKKIGTDYYFFELNRAQLCRDTSVWVDINTYGVEKGVYSVGSDGKVMVPAAMAAVASDGAETGSVAFTAQVASNAAVSADTAATVIVAALPTAVDDEDEE